MFSWHARRFYVDNIIHNGRLISLIDSLISMQFDNVKVGRTSTSGSPPPPMLWPKLLSTWNNMVYGKCAFMTRGAQIYRDLEIWGHNAPVHIPETINSDFHIKKQVLWYDYQKNRMKFKIGFNSDNILSSLEQSHLSWFKRKHHIKLHPIGAM